MYNPIRGGTRGGQGDFTWAEVSADKDRENYLGHSINAPTGRWQKNKDVHWYNRDLKDSEEEKAEEIRKIKEAEADALAVALGFAPGTKPGTSSANPNAIPVAPKPGAVEPDTKISKEEKHRLKAEKRARKEEKRAKKEERRERKAIRGRSEEEHRYTRGGGTSRQRSITPPRPRYSRSRSPPPPRRGHEPGYAARPRSPIRRRSPDRRPRERSYSPRPPPAAYLDDNTPPARDRERASGRNRLPSRSPPRRR